jgi:hypothetical protein
MFMLSNKTKRSTNQMIDVSSWTKIMYSIRSEISVGNFVLA